MQLTQKIKIEPTEEQEEVLTSLSEVCRLLYNFSLKERIEDWKKNKNKPKEDRNYITYTEQQNKLPKLKEEYPRYNWVYSKVLQMTLKKLDANYKSFFSLWKEGNEKANPPRFKGSNYLTTLCYNQSGFEIKNGEIKFSHNHPDKIELSFDIPSKFDLEDKNVKQVEIFRDEFKGEYYISVTYKEETPEYKDNGLYQAFDLGITKHTGVNMDGKFVEFKNPRPDKYWQSKIEEVQSKRDHCKKGSNRWKRYNKKLKKMKRKCANQMKDWQHKTSRKIVENTKANTIVVGDLNTKDMAQNNKYAEGLNRSLQNTGTIGRFVRFLTYKAKLVGKKVIEINEANTTKRCCVCGKKQEIPLHERTYKCDCGNEIDRDRNSAVNIMYRFLSQERSVDEQSSFMEGFLRQTAEHKMRVSPIRSWEDSQEAPSSPKVR
ncbi:MAG: IS605 OrfB-like transposable element containing RNAse H-like and Zn finger domain [Candidatus Methanohalarchaeum thermophilum]|uniref:IS605 OrfB-like transposable element containing RNAse H-like and Zn finger domain n=1 Tax=Methanohalarchaeum thermophilum TaxID=1903181 RepID=A0A1Q6DTC0_METT1|nr:MAG: IS605 OrfB-like transposable element containing RNAse H-like and Zn finger domain [Candidatus Methanohalarchaeum thermophilum]